MKDMIKTLASVILGGILFTFALGIVGAILIYCFNLFLKIGFLFWWI